MQLLGTPINYEYFYDQFVVMLWIAKKGIQNGEKRKTIDV